MNAAPASPPPQDARPAAARRARWARASVVAALLLSLVTLTLRFAYVARTSFAYDEATYVELALHPWRSSYYPDVVFVRHPPLFPVFLWAWIQAFGVGETALRIPGVLFSGGGAVLIWSAVRRWAGDEAATLCGVLLASSFALLVYGVQATMYPMAFFWASVAAWSRAHGHDRRERLALVLFALSHLFGFVFLALRVWLRPDRLREAARTGLAWAWVLLATVVVLLVRNPLGPASGPVWQALRTFELFYDLLTNHARALAHVYAFLLNLLLLGPLLLEALWFGKRRRTEWALATLFLVVFLFTGPPFLRFGLLLVPGVLLFGLRSAKDEHAWRHIGVISLLLSAAALTSATAYVNSGLEPEASYDVPGLLDWRAVASIVNASSASSMVTTSPPPPAFYLQQQHGFRVIENRQGPDVLRLEGQDGRRIDVLRGVDAPHLAAAGNNGSIVVVPQNFAGIIADLLGANYLVCAKVPGAYILAEERGAACTILRPRAG